MKKIGLKILRYIPVFVLLIILCLINSSSFAYMNAGTDYFIPDVAANIILCVSAALLYWFLLHNAVSYDIKTDERIYDGSNVFRFISKDPGLYISTGLVVLYDLIFPSSMSNRLADAIKVKPVAILISLVFIVASSLLMWITGEKNHKKQEKVKISAVLLGYVIPAAAICTLTYFIPLIAVQWNVFVFLGRFVIIGLAVFIMVIFAVKYSKALTNRKRFIVSLRSACKEKGLELSEIRHPYLSVFRDDGKISYTIKKKDVVTEHKLACCLNKSCNVLFFEEGGIIKDLPVKFGRNNVLFSLRHRIDVDSPRCYVIFTSSPDNAVNGTANGKEYLDNGVSVGSLVYYTPSGYLNDLERGLIK
ncbi:MAG: hypothetical protein J6330_10585 [Clostridia bacterium]|nr:hypothetical protein [Clostridia bacterium]